MPKGSSNDINSDECGGTCSHDVSMGDAEAFVDALINPPKPNDALKAAAIRYKQVISV
jgi:hypothetical protein